MDRDKKAPKGIVELIRMISRLGPEEFLGICKILGVKIYIEDLEEEKREEERRGAAEASNDSKVERTEDSSFKKTPRKGEFMIRDAMDRIIELNRTQRRNLKKLLRAATKGGK